MEKVASSLPLTAQENVTVGADGRVDIKLQLATEEAEAANLLIDEPPPYRELSPSTLRPFRSCLNIVIQIVGSRGDVQPFIALAKELQSHGHRIRLATHDVFKHFVQEAKIDFFPIGGDPSELMAYMVKNPGIIPKMSTIKAGDIGKKRKMIGEMLRRFWQSCVDEDPDSKAPFIADAIIANPPSFAHFHCAQALSIPLHVMFTMPWTPTRHFPHPLANIQQSNVDPRLRNMLSYGVIEMMTWQGLGDIINQWRKDDLGLEPLPLSVAANVMNQLQIPHTYCWSPALIPKPTDWGQHVDVCGFFFRENPAYSPTADIATFLAAGSAPVYIGFGSIVLDDPSGMSEIILTAVAKLGIRAIVSRGWSKLGSTTQNENILFIGDCPHEWLFQHVNAVVHHGGAGTTACGLRNGLPTVIVPFFGDQPFWGQMIATAGAGPAPIPHKQLTSENLAAAISKCLSPECMEAAKVIMQRMSAENGVRTAVASFHRCLPQDSISCDLLPDEVAVWTYQKAKNPMKLSAKAVAILTAKKHIQPTDLMPHRSNPINIDPKQWDPLTATCSSLMGTVVDFGTGLGTLLSAPTAYNKSSTSGHTGSTSAAANIGQTAGKGIATMTGSVVKGTLVDTPGALADGLHNVPRLYGEKVEKREAITDWKSGHVAAGKSFIRGFASGLSGFVTDPYKGAKQDGLLGFTKGVATGSVGLFVKPGAAMFGLLAYPAMGIYKSISSMMSPIGKEILAARVQHDEWVAARTVVSQDEVDAVESGFLSPGKA